MGDALPPMQVMLSQHAIAFAVLICCSIWYVDPWLRKKPEHVATPILLVPFLFRFIGNANMVVGVVGPDYPLDAAWMVVIGDSLSAVLALVALGLYRYRSRWARAAAWAVALESVVYSTIYAVTNDIQTLVENLHAHWYVGAVFVPILLVDTAYLMVVLWRR